MIDYTQRHCSHHKAHSDFCHPPPPRHRHRPHRPLLQSDSYPQTNPGYYGCQTLAHVNAWRERLAAPLLPWVFVHLQPYTGSMSGASELEPQCGERLGDPLAELRHEQLNAMHLPKVGYANAIDLGDPTSPYGNVHFQNKQVISKRLVSAALAVAFGKAGGAGGALTYPPPRFLDQVPAPRGGGCSMTVSFRAGAGMKRASGGAQKLVFGATADPGLPAEGSSAICPTRHNVNASNCAAFELLCASSDLPKQVNQYQWVKATPTLGADGTTLTLVATGSAGQNSSLLARGSRYAWGQWPLATLFAAVPDSSDAAATGLPILPWNQALTCSGGNTPGAVC